MGITDDIASIKKKHTTIKYSSAIFREKKMPPPISHASRFAISSPPPLAPSSFPFQKCYKSYLWPSIAAMAFCWGGAGWDTGGHMGCWWWRWWWRLWLVGDEGGIQAGWWLGGEEAQKGLKLPGGEHAMDVMGLLLLWRFSEVRSLENIARASGKLGGVAGVLLGVHIWRRQKNRIIIKDSITWSTWHQYGTLRAIRNSI